MKLSIPSIKNPQVRAFYSLWWPQHQILYDFFSRLTDEQWDGRMVETAERKSDTPRESLAHLMYVQRVYLNGVRTGTLEFKSMGVEHCGQMTPAALLAEWEHLDQETFSALTAETFDPLVGVAVPWGGRMNAIDVLYFLRDHDILHIGWNLALMDRFNLPRFKSLIDYWGP